MTTENREKFVQMFTPVRQALIRLTAQMSGEPQIRAVEEIEEHILSKPEDSFVYFRDLQLRLFEDDVQIFQELGDNRLGKSAAMDRVVARFAAVHHVESAWGEFRKMFLIARHNVLLYHDTKDALPTRVPI